MAKFMPHGKDRKAVDLALSDIRMWARWRRHTGDVPEDVRARKARPRGIAQTAIEQEFLADHESYPSDGDSHWSMTPEFRSDAFHTYLQVEVVCGDIGWQGNRDWLLRHGGGDYRAVMRDIGDDELRKAWYREVLRRMGEAAVEWELYRRA